MSNLIFNLRIGFYHLQITKDWKFSWARNTGIEKAKPWIKLHQIGSYHA